MRPDLTQQSITAVSAESASSSTLADDTQPHLNATTGVDGKVSIIPGTTSHIEDRHHSAPQATGSGSPAGKLGDNATSHSENAALSPAAHIAGEAEMKPASINAAPDVGEETESGWAAVARSIRHIDEQKIKGYTDDIDNILVFAGLYSAVLTALLIESYQALQPDPSSIMITLLSQLVTQTHTYKLTSGFLNSTIPPLDVAAVPLQFQPSLAAKRVNVLWFASLTLSLISASFGILVKQWLREYLFGESVSPQAQLRVRHFRTPGLDHWRVFTIAALLPLVLQLALALFFVGLCFFSLDVHQSIGYTTIPLVAGWAFLFLAASFGPAVSPRCPYKIPVFRYVMTLLRTGLFYVTHLWKGMRALPPKSAWPIKPDWTWWSLGYNESDALQDGRNDVDILADVDASQRDDHLLTKMCNALKEKHNEPSPIVNFVLRIIASRLHTEVQEHPIPLMLDLSQLPVQTSTILMDAIADVLEREVRRLPESQPIEWNDLTRDCLFLLSARLPCLLSTKAMKAVSLCFTGTRDYRLAGTFALIFTDVSPNDLQPEDLQRRQLLGSHLLERLRNAFMHLNAWQLQYTISVIAKKCCCTCDNCKTFVDVMKKHKSAVPPVLGQYMCDILTGYLLHQVKHDKDWNEWHRDILLDLLTQRRGAEKEPWHDVLEDLVRHLVTKEKYASYFYRFLFHRIEYNKTAQVIFNNALIASNDLEQALTNLYNVFTRYVDEMMKRPELLDNQFVEKLYLFFYGQTWSIGTVVMDRKRAVVEEVYLPLWQKTWKTMHTAMHSLKSLTSADSHATWACWCLGRIDDIDDQWLPTSKMQADKGFDGWAETFNPARSFFDDDIIQDFMTLLPSAEYGDYKRVRRIHRNRELEEEKKAAELEEGNNDSGAYGDSTDDDGMDNNNVDATEAANAHHAGTLLDGKEAMVEVLHRHADGCQTDDWLVMKMCSALMSMRTDPELTIDFVLKIIAFQLQTEFKRPLPHTFDFLPLPVQACTILMNTVANVFTHEVKRFQESGPIKQIGLICDCLSLLTAHLPCPLSYETMAAIAPCFASNGSRAAFKLMFTNTQPEEHQDLCLYLQHWLRNAFPHLDLERFLNAIHNIMKELCCSCGYCRDIDALLGRHAKTISSALKQHTCDVLVGYMLHQVHVGTEFNKSHRMILRILLSQRRAGTEDAPWYGVLNELVSHLLTNPIFAPQFYPLLFSKYHYTRSAAPVFMDVFISSKKKQRILVNMHNVFLTYVAENGWLRDDNYSQKLLWYTNSQMAPMMYVAKNEDRAVVEALYLPVWQLIWKTVHSAMIGIKRSRRTTKLTKRASKCLEKIDKLDNLWLAPTASENLANMSKDFDNWVKVFDPAKSFFGDDLIEDLMTFLPTDEFAKYKRVRRIQQIHALQGEHTQESADDDDDDVIQYWWSEAGYDYSSDDDDCDDDNSVDGGPEDDNNSLSASSAAASTVGPTDGLPDNVLIAPSSVFGELSVNANMNDNLSTIPSTPAADAKPDPGQLFEITHAGTLGGEYAEPMLVNDATGRAAADFGGTMPDVAQ